MKGRVSEWRVVIDGGRVEEEVQEDLERVVLERLGEKKGE